METPESKPDEASKPVAATPTPTPTTTIDFSAKAILRIALPALGSLVIEPLLILIDTLMIGHLGKTPLAGLSLASTILTTVVGIFVFLAYSTTSSVARAVGAGSNRKAIEAGIQSMWLAGALGVVMVGALIAMAEPLLWLLGARNEVAHQAWLYLLSSCPGLVGMFVILSANGILRGLLDTKTPLRVLFFGALGNVAANVIFIYGLDLGIVGAGLGVSLAQSGMAIALTWTIIAKAKTLSASLKPSKTGIVGSLGQGIPLLIRTIALRTAILTTTAAITYIGVTSLAANQIANSIWQIFQFALDSLAIAAQGLIGVAVGAGNKEVIQTGSRKLIIWGVFSSLGLGILLIAGSHWLPQYFNSDPQVQASAAKALLVIGIFLPLSGWAYILDGILIGAGKTKYMAFSSVTMVLAYLPVLGGILWWSLRNSESSGLTTSSELTVFIAIMLAYNGWMTLVRVVLNQYKVSHLNT